MKRIRFILFAAISISFIQLKGQNMEARSSAVNAINNLTFDLFGQLNKDGENLFYSPYSVSTALAMTYEGAKGATEKEMIDVMNFPEKKDILHQGNAILTKELNKNEKFFELNVANSLWAQEGFKFNEEYFKKIKLSYNTTLDYLNFKKDAEKGREKINKWVEKVTKNKIKELIPKGGINDLTRMVLTNAIYFKAEWQNQFKEGNTKKDTFFVSQEKKVEVPFMNMKIRVKYLEEQAFQLLEIPYQRNIASMVVLLPKKGISMDEVKKNLSNENYLINMKKMQYETVDISLPKFKFSSDFDLSGVLKVMGMETAFSDEADFSGMTGKPDLKISKVFHKAYIDVNEEGTEAAAATAVVMMEKSAMPPREFYTFKADHPFIFFIKENTSQAILFAGKVANPEIE